MGKSMMVSGGGASPLMDRLFAGGCTALFLLLMGSAAQAALVYWG